MKCSSVDAVGVRPLPVRGVVGGWAGERASAAQSLDFVPLLPQLEMVVGTLVTANFALQYLKGGEGTWAGGTHSRGWRLGGAESAVGGTRGRGTR